MPINNRGLAGQPSLPYVDARSYVGADVFFDLAFLDHSGVAVIPSSLTYQVDDLTNAVNMVSATTVTPSAATMTLQIAGAKWVMTHDWQGSQICQVSWSAVITDSVTNASATIKGVSVVELCSIQTPFGA